MFPVCIFAYKRKAPLENLIQSLLNNPDAADTDLYIFCDGSKNTTDNKAVASVRKFCNQITGFRTVTVSEAAINSGLAKSIIHGVTELFNKYDALIVLEDDLIVSHGFLTFMNEGLRKCKDNPNIISICGYSKRIPSCFAHKSGEVYLHGRSSSWGWGTWASKWSLIDFDHVYNLTFIQKLAMYLNLFILAPDLPLMIRAQRNQIINSWAIRFVEAEARLKMGSLFPSTSLVENYGFDGDATNCDIQIGFDSDFAHSNEVSAWSLPKSTSHIFNMYFWVHELIYGIVRMIRRKRSKS